MVVNNLAKPIGAPIMILFWNEHDTWYSGEPVISCECLIGYEVPAGADPFDGCVQLGT